MRTGLWMTSLVAILLMTISVGCEPAKTETKKDVGKKEEKKEQKKHEEYHPGHSSYGLVYHTDGLEPAVAVKLNGDTGIVTITNQPKDNTEDFKDTPIAVSEVIITPPKVGTEEKTFSLPAKNKGTDEKASVFELEDPALAVAMTGEFTVSFELDGKKHEYKVFPHSH